MAGRNNPKTGGRKLGTPNKNKGQHAAAIREALEEKGITPLQFMLAVMRDPAQPPSVRMDMAKAAAPFCHAKRLPETGEGRPNQPFILVTNVDPFSRPEE